MPAGKRKLKQLFVGGMQIGKTGINHTQLLTGSVGFATTGCANTAAWNACSVAEVAITNLGACDIVVGTVWGMSACYMYNHEILAGDGQASIVYRYAGCSSSVDARAGTNGGTLRYIALTI